MGELKTAAYHVGHSISSTPEKNKQEQKHQTAESKKKTPAKLAASTEHTLNIDLPHIRALIHSYT